MEISPSDAPPSRTRSIQDFPYYDGRPVLFALPDWLALLALTAAGFVALVGVQQLWPGDPGRWTGVALFVALPLLGLRLAAGRDWAAAFRRPSAGDVLIGLAFVPVTMIASGLVAFLVMRVSLTAANPSAALLGHMTDLQRVAFVASTGPQLFGEELVTILPLLAFLAAFHQILRIPRRASVAAAWVGSALIFAALHLPTYQWHLVQTLAVIGASRLTLSLPYLITKTIWSSTITHITNDWLLLAFVIFASAHGG